jgi:peptidoglycan/xylan/chitin deacetylase (PgdA/CDA1 family)
MAALKRFIEYVKSHDKVWLATREQIAQHWLATHPFEASERLEE